MRTRLLVILLLVPLLVLAGVRLDATSAAGSGQAKARASQAPTQVEAATIYPYLERRTRTVRRLRPIQVQGDRCVRTSTITRSRRGLVASYADGVAARRDAPEAALHVFGSARRAKAVMQSLRAFTRRCAGRSTVQGVTNQVRRFPTEMIGDGRSVSYRSHLTSGAREVYEVDIFSRLGNAIVRARVTNAERPPRRVRAQRFSVRQVQAYVAEADASSSGR